MTNGATETSSIGAVTTIWLLTHSPVETRRITDCWKKVGFEDGWIKDDIIEWLKDRMVDEGTNKGRFKN